MDPSDRKSTSFPLVSATLAGVVTVVLGWLAMELLHIKQEIKAIVMTLLRLQERCAHDRPMGRCVPSPPRVQVGRDANEPPIRGDDRQQPHDSHDRVDASAVGTNEAHDHGSTSDADSASDEVEEIDSTQEPTPLGGPNRIDRIDEEGPDRIDDVEDEHDQRDKSQASAQDLNLTQNVLDARVDGAGVRDGDVSTVREQDVRPVQTGRKKKK